MGIQLTEDALEDALSAKPKRENMRWKSLLIHWHALIDDLKIRLARDLQGDKDAKEIKALLSQELLGRNGKAIVPQSEGSFVPFFEAHANLYERRSTRESYFYTLSCMRKFASNLDSLNFEDINYAWLSDFEKYMKENGLSQNTRKIHFGNIRTAMREAYKRELTEADPFRRFSFRPAKTAKRSLTIEQLRELLNFPVEPFAEIYRDMFALIFMLIGVNTIDLYNLKEINAHGRVEYSRSKTAGLFSLRVEQEALDIINKYRGVKNLLCLADRWSDYRNFRHQLNSAISRFGKAQGKGRKDKEGDGPFAEVTSYWARHTWATIAADLDIPDATISLALGHGGENRVTDIYIKRNLRKVDEANREVLDWVLYGKR